MEDRATGGHCKNPCSRAKVILADEPISMLDVSIRLGILNLMDDLKRKQGISFLYITRDIATARYFSERTAVLYAGHMVEWGESDQLLKIQNIPTPNSSLIPFLIRTESKERKPTPGKLKCLNGLEIARCPLRNAAIRQ